MFFSILKISATFIIASLAIFGSNYSLSSDNVFGEIDTSILIYATTNSSPLQNQADNTKSNNNSSASDSGGAIMDKIQDERERKTIHLWKQNPGL